MIVIKIELHSAVTHKVTKLGEAVITNEGLLLPGNRCNYKLHIARKCHSVADILYNGKKPVRTGRARNWPRASKTVWQLLQHTLNTAYPL